MKEVKDNVVRQFGARHLTMEEYNRPVQSPLLKKHNIKIRFGVLLELCNLIPLGRHQPISLKKLTLKAQDIKGLANDLAPKKINRNLIHELIWSAIVTYLYPIGSSHRGNFRIVDNEDQKAALEYLVSHGWHERQVYFGDGSVGMKDTLRYKALQLCIPIGENDGQDYIMPDEKWLKEIEEEKEFFEKSNKKILEKKKATQKETINELETEKQALAEKADEHQEEVNKLRKRLAETEKEQKKKIRIIKKKHQKELERTEKRVRGNLKWVSELNKSIGVYDEISKIVENSPIDIEKSFGVETVKELTMIQLAIIFGSEDVKLTVD